MKKTQIKDGLRNIWKQKVSFLSVIIITMIGVAAFLGIDYTAASLYNNGTAQYDRLHFRDVEVVSTLLLTEQDLADIKNTEGVADAEGVYAVSAKASFGDESGDVTAVSLTERFNRPDVIEGKLPERDDECAVEQKLAAALGLRVGDTVDLRVAGTAASYLTGDAFVVTGIVVHPDHLNNIVPDVPYLLVRPTAFDAEALGGCFMKAEIALKKPAGLDRFSKKYQKLTQAVTARLQDELAPAALARRQTDMQTQLTDGYAQLEAAKATIRDTVKTAFTAAFPNDAAAGLMQWAEVRVPDLDDARETARYLWITENTRIDLASPLADYFRAVIEAQSVPDELLVALYEAVLNQVAPQDGLGHYYMDAICTALINEAEEAADGYRQLADACALWDEGHERYLTATEDPGRWFVFDGGGNASFVQLQTACGNFEKLKVTFSLLFVVVGALVIFATVGKMVEEQRRQVGTTKALGFFNREIFMKYLGFGVLGTTIGAGLGIAAARFGIAPIMIRGFDHYYEVDMSRISMTLLPTVIVFFAGALLAFLAIAFATLKMLREPAIRLMQPKMPGAKKKAAKRGGRTLPLYSRLILLNMRTDLKRVVVTIVSVAGCCALIVTGLTLRHAVRGCVERQYNDIVDYDICVRFDPEAGTQAAFEDALEAAGATGATLFDANVTYTIQNLQAAELYCGDIRTIQEFYHLTDVKTGKPCAPTDRGVLIQRRLAEIYDLDAGSTFDIALGGTKTATVRVAGVYENYIGRAIIMSPVYYQTLYGEACRPNACFVRLNGADGDALQKTLAGIEGYQSVTAADAERSVIESSTVMLETVVALFIFIAAVMAGVVQLNLTNMYVTQKKRELSIMRVNGFTTREVILYLLRETFFTTAAGIVLGIGVGVGIGYNIIRTLEQAFLQFDRSVSPIAWLCGAALTVLFTVIVNAVALRRVRYLKLTDAA